MNVKHDRADIIRAAAVAAMTAAQIVTTFAPEIMGAGQPVGVIVAPFSHSLTPPGYAFAIWGVIYTGALLFAVWQALPSNYANPVARAIGWPAVGMFACNAAWQVSVPLFSVDWTSTALLALELVLGMIALLRLAALQGTLSRSENWLAAVPIGILTGWISAATFVNLSTSLIWADAAFDPREAGNAALLLAAAILFATGAVNQTRSWAQAAAILWALHGIAVTNLVMAGETLIGAMAVFGALLVVAARLSPRLQFPLAGRRRSAMGSPL